MVDRFTISYCDKESFYCLFVIAVAEKIGKRGLVVWSGPGQCWAQLLSANLRLARAEKLPDLHKSSVRRSMQMHLKEERAGGGQKWKETRHFPLSRLCFVLFLSWDRWHEWRRRPVVFSKMSFSSNHRQATFTKKAQRRTRGFKTTVEGNCCRDMEDSWKDLFLTEAFESETQGYNNANHKQ